MFVIVGKGDVPLYEANFNSIDITQEQFKIVI